MPHQSGKIVSPMHVQARRGRVDNVAKAGMVETSIYLDQVFPACKCTIMHAVSRGQRAAPLLQRKRDRKAN